MSGRYSLQTYEHKALGIGILFIMIRGGTQHSTSVYRDRYTTCHFVYEKIIFISFYC